MSRNEPAAASPRQLLVILAIAFCVSRAVAPPLSEGTGAPPTRAEIGRILDGHPHLRRHVLDNGFEVIVLELPGTPIATSLLQVLAGSAHEAPHRGGTAHLLEHLQFGRLRIFEDIRAIGASTNAFTNHATIDYFLSGPAEQLEGMAWIELQRYAEPEITEWLIARELPVIEAERGVATDTATTAAVRRALEQLWAGHPYGEPILGPTAELAAAEPRDLRAYWSRTHVPMNTRWIVTGGVRAEEVFALAERTFGWIPPGEPLPPVPPTPIDVGTALDDPPEIRTIGSVDGGHALILALSIDTTTLRAPWTDPEAFLVWNLVTASFEDGRQGLVARLRARFGESVAVLATPVLVPGAYATIVQIHAEEWPGAELLAEAVAEELRRVRDEGLPPALGHRVHQQFLLGMLRSDTADESASGIGRVLGNGAYAAGTLSVSADAFARRSISSARFREVAEGGLGTVLWLHADPDTPTAPPPVGDPTAPEGETPSWVERPIPEDRFPEEVPIREDPAPVASIETVRTRLRCGVPVVVIPDPHAERVEGWIHAGDRTPTPTDARDRTGDPVIAGILGLATQPRHPDLLTGVWSNDAGLSIGLTGHEQRVGRFVSTLRRWVLSPEIDRTRIREEESRWLARVEREKRDPALFANMLLSRSFGDTWMERPPELPTTLSDAELLDHWRRALDPRRSVIVIGGAVSPETLIPRLEAAFAEWVPPSRPTDAAATTPAAPHPSGRRAILAPRPGNHLEIRLAYPLRVATEPGVARRERALLERLATQIGWWLFDWLRESSGLSYTPWADGTGDAIDDALVIGLDYASTDLIALLDELEKGLPLFANAESFYPDDPRVLRESTIAWTRAGLTARLATVLQREARPYAPTIEERFRLPRTPSELAAVGRKVFVPENLTLVVVGPLDETQRALVAERFPTVQVIEAEVAAEESTAEKD